MSEETDNVHEVKVKVDNLYIKLSEGRIFTTLGQQHLEEVKTVASKLLIPRSLK
jgi:hypothetical protein